MATKKKPKTSERLKGYDPTKKRPKVKPQAEKPVAAKPKAPEKDSFRKLTPEEKKKAERTGRPRIEVKAPKPKDQDSFRKLTPEEKAKAQRHSTRPPPKRVQENVAQAKELTTYYDKRSGDAKTDAHEKGRMRYWDAEAGKNAKTTEPAKSPNSAKKSTFDKTEKPTKVGNGARKPTAGEPPVKVDFPKGKKSAAASEIDSEKDAAARNVRGERSSSETARRIAAERDKQFGPKETGGKRADIVLEGERNNMPASRRAGHAASAAKKAVKGAVKNTATAAKGMLGQAGQVMRSGPVKGVGAVGVGIGVAALLEYALGKAEKAIPKKGVLKGAQAKEFSDRQAAAGIPQVPGQQVNPAPAPNRRADASAPMSQSSRLSTDSFKPVGGGAATPSATRPTAAPPSMGRNSVAAGGSASPGSQRGGAQTSGAFRDTLQQKYGSDVRDLETTRKGAEFPIYDKGSQTAGDFRKEYAKAAASGAKDFPWQGRMYKV